MKTEFLLAGAVAVPSLLCFLLPVLGSFSKRTRNICALILVSVSLACSAGLLPEVSRGNIVSLRVALPLGLDLALSADCLAVFMALVSAFISAVIVLYSFGYISHYGHQNEYYLMVTLFVGSMMGICYSANLILLYVFWEITALTSWRLIGFFREPVHVVKADKAFMVTVFGALLMLLGFVILYEQGGSFDMASLGAVFAERPISRTAAVLILVGILSKSATLPFHTWLPDAGVAPSPVTALLHAAVLVKIGVYVFARLFLSTFAPEQALFYATGIIAAVSMFVSAGAALIETDLKRIIAYSTVSQIGFIFLGLSTGTAMGVAGGLLYILMHGLAKGGLFLSAGIVEQNMKTKDIRELGGLMKSMPVTAVSFLMCAFSVMGIPPFGGFFGKYMVIAGAVNAGRTALALVFVLGGVFTMLYLFRVFNFLFLRPAQAPVRDEGSPVMVWTVASLAALSLASGIFINYSSAFVDLIVSRMTGVAP